MSWIVVYTKPRQEVRAKENLECLGVEVRMPQRPVEKIVRGSISINYECLFPRYIFVKNQSDVFLRVMHKLRNVRGVSKIVKVGDQFAELDDESLEGILSFERTLSSRPVKAFHSGESVIFTHGAFQGVRGIYQEADGDKRVILLFDLLHKPTKLSVPLTSVRRR
jgi:transcriptional antiterminator RfaH